MKKLITITVAFLAAVCMNAQELCSFNPNNELGLGSNFNYNTTLYAGEVIGKTNSIVCTVGANDMYQSWSYPFSAGNGFIKGGLQGQTNPTDVNGEKPSKSLLPPVNGAFLRFEAKADGWLSVLLFASSHKAYTVFEDGKAIGYTFGAIGSASSDLGAVYQFAILGEGQNNEVKNPIEFAEQEFLKATAPSKYNARWSWDAEGNNIWNQIKINGRGVIKFHVKKGGNYIVNANGSKITAEGFCFDTHGNTVIKADGTTILSAGTEFYNKRTIHVATAGTLPNLISNYEKNLIEELTLTGYLNGTDIACIRRMAGSAVNYDYDNGSVVEEMENNQIYGRLYILDISGATIVSGGSAYKQVWHGWPSDAPVYTDLELSWYTSDNTISEYMFDDCIIAKVSLPNNIKRIENYAFRNNLTEIVIPQSVTSIGSRAFSRGSGLTSVKVESGNQMYDSRNNCNAIIETSSNKLIFGCKNTIIPNSVTSIGDFAFFNCTGLTSILSLNNTPPTCEISFSYNNSFYNVNKENCVLWVPKGCVNVYREANVWKDFPKIRGIIDGDVNLDIEVNQADLDGTVDFIMGKDPEGFYENLADLNGDDVVDAADVVKLVTIKNIHEGLSMDYQAKNINQVISSLSCTLNNDGDKAIQLTKCELYCNHSVVSSSKFKVTLAKGESKKCSFDELESLSSITGFSVVWYYTYNGEDYTYCCEIEE